MSTTQEDLKVILPVTPRKDLVPRPSPLIYSQIFKAKIIIDRKECRLHEQHYFLSYKSHHELIEFVKALHEVCRCGCGTDWPYFDVYPYKNGEGLVIK